MNNELILNPKNKFNFDRFLIPENQQSIINNEIKSKKPINFDDYLIKEPEGYLESGLRHITRTASRIGETIAGFPGDTVQLIKKGAEYLPEIPTLPFLPEKEPNFLQKIGKEALESLPTSESLKKKSEELTKGYTAPKGSGEEFSDDVASLSTILFSPSKALSSIKGFVKTLGKNVLKATTSKGAGKGVELLGANENQKLATELGVLFLTGLTNKKTAEKFVGEQYQQARSKIPPNTMINTSRFENALNNVENQINKGISTNTKNEVLKPLRELKNKASGGAMEIDEVVESLHNINERINSKKLFDEISTSERKLLKSRYDLLKNEVHLEIANYGKSNPEFYKQWSEANKSYQTIAESKKISNFIQSKVGKLPKHLAGSLALDVFLGSPASTVGVLGAYGSVKGYELLHRIFKDKNLRHHYMKVILEASNENLPATIKNLNLLDKGLNKLEFKAKDR